MRFTLITIIFCLLQFFAFAEKGALHCSNNQYRNWWDIKHYDLHVTILPNEKKTVGTVVLRAQIISKSIDTLQIDLQNPLKIKKITFKGKDLKFNCVNESYLVIGSFSHLNINQVFELTIIYEGEPIIAKNPPWDGGFVVKKDTNNKPWLAVACQENGASLWWPCKDFPADEPDEGVDTYFTTSSELSAIGNGRLIKKTVLKNDLTEWHWRTENPINLYDVTFYIGDYVHWSDTLAGKKGKLSLDYYVLKDNFEKAKKHFEIVPTMLHCFEDWFGPYPFYEDGYKLIEAPYLGMEHQSAVAYGNEFKQGYQGKDRSGTGVGLLFDFIIVHESGHEWFGNNISINDMAYAWVHEGFTTYSETIFLECKFGKEKAFEYQRGQWHIIMNEKPIEGIPNQCDGGSGDQYEKASAMIHMIRQIMKDDDKFKQLLIALNTQFHLKTVSGSQVENFINDFTGIDFSKLFEQYLRTIQIPVLQIKITETEKTYFRWNNCVENYNMPVQIEVGNEKTWLYPTENWQELPINPEQDLIDLLHIAPDFLANFEFVGASN